MSAEQLRDRRNRGGERSSVLSPPPLPRPQLFRNHSPTLQFELERIAAERLAAQRAIERAARWEFLRAMFGVVDSCLVGLVIMGVGLHVTDRQLGRIWASLGLLVGYGGIFYSLFSAYRRGEKRGDW